MEIRKTEFKDLTEVMQIYKGARAFMKANGNPDQWGDNWPSQEKIEEDIKKQISYVVIDNNEIVAVFAYVVGIDKTYIDIREGKWNSEDTYGTIHRLASSFKVKGVFPFIMEYLTKIYNVNFRIDTHENNKPMIKQILANGYKYTGKITPIEGGERLAFDKIIH